jgi:hypothetical protein
VSAFIEEYRARFGVEPICETLGVSASVYYERATGRRSAMALEDERLIGVISELHEPATAPTARAGCGRHSSARASRSGAAGWSA